jgi:integrase
MAEIVKEYESGGRIYTDSKGRYIAYIRRSGKTYQKRVKSVIEGEQFIFSKLGNMQTLTDAQYTEALHCFNLLPPEFKLLDVVNAGLNLLVNNSKCLIHDAVNDWLKFSETNLRPHSYKIYEWMGSKIKHRFPNVNTPITDLTKDVIYELIGKNSGLAERTQINNLRIISALSSYLNKREKINYNLVRGVILPKPQRALRGVLSVKDAARLIYYLRPRSEEEIVGENLTEHMLNAINDWRLFILLQMFAGLRPIECCRLQIKDIHIDAETPYIYIGHEVAKGRLGGVNDRQVELHPLLIKYLRVYVDFSKPEEFICKRTYKYYGIMSKDFYARAGVSHTHDVLRHSAASYFYASGMTSDECARRLGHGIAVANNHYRNKQVTKQEAEQYFALTFAKAKEILAKTDSQNADAQTENINIEKEKGRKTLEKVKDILELQGKESLAKKIMEAGLKKLDDLNK